MNFRVRLLHADGLKRIVVAQAFEGEQCLGSALGEASSAEEAEDRAIDRLLLRLQSSSIPSRSVSPPPEPPPAPTQLPAAAPPQSFSPISPIPEIAAREAGPLEPLPDPQDWSSDLGRLDRLLQHLGWGREQERTFLQRLFGQPHRSRLTRYSDLMVLHRALEALPPGSDPGTAPLPQLRSELLCQCDALLIQLGWQTDRARQVLEHHFAVSTRQLLSDDQLLAFNLLLEGELLDPSRPGDLPSFA